jgi:hypothetical protein
MWWCGVLAAVAWLALRLIAGLERPRPRLISMKGS